MVIYIASALVSVHLCAKSLVKKTINAKQKPPLELARTSVASKNVKIPEYALKKYFYADKNSYLNRNLRSLLSLGHSSFYILVPEASDYKKFDDLDQIGIEESDISGEKVVKTLDKKNKVKILKSKGILKSVEGFCQKHDHALAFMDTSPSFLIALIKKACPVREIKLTPSEMDNVIHQSPSFRKVQDSPSLESPQKEGVERLATRLIFITHDAIPGDVIKNILDEVQENFFFIRAYHLSLRNLNLIDTFKDMPIPRHIGVNWFLQDLARKVGASKVPISQYIPQTLDVVTTKSQLEKASLEPPPLEFNRNIVLAEEILDVLEKPEPFDKEPSKNLKKAKPSQKKIEKAQ